MPSDAEWGHQPIYALQQKLSTGPCFRAANIKPKCDANRSRDGGNCPSRPYSAAKRKQRERSMLASGSRKSSILGLVTLLLAGLSAFAQQGADPTHNLTPVTDAMLRNPPAADWLMWRRTFDGHGFSPLDQINKSNVKDLQV